MAYFGEETEYYNNYNNDVSYNQNISYDPTYYPSEYCVYQPRFSEVYQHKGGAYSNENFYESRGDYPFDGRAYPNYSEDELIPSYFKNQAPSNVMNYHQYPMMPSNSFGEDRGENVRLHNELIYDNRQINRTESSRRTNRSPSVQSSVYPKNHGLNIQINGKKIPREQPRSTKYHRREGSDKSWVSATTNADRITEDACSYINELEEQEQEYGSGNYQHFETTENGRTTIININCSNNLKNNAITNDSDDNNDSDDDEEEEETTKNQKKKPTKPKKIFMGKYLFSDIKNSLMYPLTICAPHPTLIYPNVRCGHYKISPKSRGEKDRKPEIVVRY